MPNNEIDEEEATAEAEALAEVEKIRCRSNRRPSVQFIDKNVIRRRSSGPDKQQPRLPSISSKFEDDSVDDQEKRYCEIDVT